MTPSFIGRYAVISPGVRPTISLASLPTASILLSRTETATTEGSLRTIPLPGTKTSTVVVPRYMPSLGEKEKAIWRVHCIRFFSIDKRRYSPRLERLGYGFLLACASRVWFLGLISHQNFFEKLSASSQTFFR